MVSRWRPAFFALVFLIMGGIGWGALVWWVSFTLEYWVVYSALSLVGLVGFGFFTARAVRRQPTQGEVEVDELEGEVDKDILQLED